MLARVKVDADSDLLPLDRTMRFNAIDIHQSNGHWLQYWTQLVGEAAPSFFLSPEAISTWVDHHSEELPLSLILGYESERPVIACIIGQAPFVRHNVFRGSALHINVSGVPSDDFLYMEHNDILINPEVDEEYVLSGLFRYLMFEWPSPWDEIVIPGLGADSHLARHLRASLPDELNLLADKESEAPYVDLDALRDAGADYLDTLSANTRMQIRQTLRAYGTESQIDLQAASTTSEALEIFHELTALHQIRWKNRGQAGAFSEPALLAFHEDLISRCLSKGTVELLRVRWADETIACLYCFLYGRHVFYYQSGILSSEDNRKRPGMLSHYLAIRRYLEAGYSTYDFLAGDHRFKLSLSNRSTPMSWLRLQRPRFRLRIEQLLRRGKTALGM